MGAIYLIMNLLVGEQERSQDSHPLPRNSWWRGNRELVDGE